ncbi:MAG: hypothetical protein ACE5PM_01020 [Candidatus Hydrothermarchaeales archaeon]
MEKIMALQTGNQMLVLILTVLLVGVIILSAIYVIIMNRLIDIYKQDLSPTAKKKAERIIKLLSFQLLFFFIVIFSAMLKIGLLVFGWKVSANINLLINLTIIVPFLISQIINFYTFIYSYRRFLRP